MALNECGCHEMSTILSEGRFDVGLWRAILGQVVRTIDVGAMGLEVICPFGFEVFQSAEFLSRKLARLYCYVGVPDHAWNAQLPIDIELLFLETLLSKVTEVDSPFVAEIALAKTTSGIWHYRPEGHRYGINEKFIYVR